jgi:hypothetical protein
MGGETWSNTMVSCELWSHERGSDRLRSLPPSTFHAARDIPSECRPTHAQPSSVAWRDIAASAFLPHRPTMGAQFLTESLEAATGALLAQRPRDSSLFEDIG